MIARKYQSDCCDGISNEWKEAASAMIVVPTGCGKTIIIALMCKRKFPYRTMILAHRQELIWQAADKIKRVTGFHCEIEMGEYKSSLDTGLFGSKAQVVISTIQTHTSGGDGGGRMGKFDPMQFGLLVIDEAHHATSPSYRKVIDYYRTNPNLKVLGVTATPDRADEEALGQVFDTVAFDYEILDAIHDGWLVPIDQQMVNVSGLDFSQVRTTAGDLNGADLAKIMEQEHSLQGVAAPTIEIIGTKRTIVFTSSVKHAELLSAIFNRYKAGMSSWVCGKTDKDDRKKILSDFDSGKIQVVCNCGVLTEGYDSPGVEVIVMARPTKSRALYAQMIGRSFRPLPGIVDFEESDSDTRKHAIAQSIKPSCLVIDFVGNSGKHKLMTTADILGGNVSDAAIELAIITARKGGKPVRMAELLEDEEAQSKEREQKRIDEEAQAKEREQKRLDEEARKARLIAKASFTKQEINPFDILAIKPVKQRAWDNNKQLSEKQNGFLKKFGINPDKLQYGEAKQLIGEMLNRMDKKLCTLKQAALLKKHGYDTQMTFADAGATIDRLAKNGWKKPLAPVWKTPVKELAAVGADDDNIPF